MHFSLFLFVLGKLSNFPKIKPIITATCRKWCSNEAVLKGQSEQIIVVIKAGI